MAVFSLAYNGQGGCTGTCITPHVGLTATHCIEGEPASILTALFGDREDQPTTTVQVSAVEQAPDGGDLALLAFEEACPAVIPYNRTALEGHVGEPVVMVGFGVTAEEAEDAGIKRSGTATLFSVDPAEVNGMEERELATSNSPAGTCYGDSGGPTFMTFDGSEHVVGVTSRGSLDAQGREEPCGSGRSIAVRADSYSTFIDQFIELHDPTGADDVADAGSPGGGGDGGVPPGEGADSGVPPAGAGDGGASPGGAGNGDDPRGDVSGVACQAGGNSAGGGDLLLVSGLALLAVRRRRRRARATS